VVATRHWRDYIGDLKSRLDANVGMILWQNLLVTGDAQKNAYWKLLCTDWTSPLMSIIFARNGVVTSMIDPPSNLPFLPLDPSRPETFPPLRGLDFTPYRHAVDGQLSHSTK
jgi:hypothetical protein